MHNGNNMRAKRIKMPGIMETHSAGYLYRVYLKHKGSRFLETDIQIPSHPMHTMQKLMLYNYITLKLAAFDIAKREHV